MPCSKWVKPYYSKITTLFVNFIKGNFMIKYKKWNNEELNFIKNNGYILRDKELADKLSTICEQNITPSMVRRQRRKLDIQKPKGRKPTSNITNC